MATDPLRMWTDVRCRRMWRGRRFCWIARMPDECGRHVLAAGDLRVQVDDLRVLAAAQPAPDVERELRVRGARLRGGEDLVDGGEPRKRVEGRQRRGALAGERTELVAQRREELALMQMLRRERIRPRLLVPRHGVLLRH